MSKNKCKTSSINQQNQVVNAELFKPCDKTRNKNVINEINPALTSEHVEKTQRAHLSSPEDVQETPLDFSLPKRIKVNTNCPHTSSPPLNMSSQRTTPDYSHEVGSNGSKSPPNLYSEHPNNTALEIYANGHIVGARMSPEMMVRERSQSFSSIRHVICHPSHGIPSSSGVVPLSTHQLNDQTLIQNVTLPVTYTDLCPQSLPAHTSPSMTRMSSLKPDVLHLYNDRIGKLSNDNRHYPFLSSGVPCCIAENLSRNSMTATQPNVLPSSLPGSTSLYHTMPTSSVTPTASITNVTKPVAKVKSTSPTPTVTTSATTTTAKRRPRSLPDDQKDEAYWERRRKNNEAAKRSRDARRLKEEEIASRANMLERENIQLQSEVANLKTETEKLRILLYDN